MSAVEVTVTVSPPQLSIREGQEAVFQCTSTGNPPPLVRWSRGVQVKIISLLHTYLWSFQQGSGKPLLNCIPQNNLTWIKYLIFLVFNMIFLWIFVKRALGQVHFSLHLFEHLTFSEKYLFKENTVLKIENHLIQKNICLKKKLMKIKNHYIQKNISLKNICLKKTLY